MPVEINPRRIVGAWDEGYVLDRHTVESRMVGYNEFGHEVFATTRTPLGELLFRRKYRGDRTSVTGIVDTVVSFLEKASPQLEIVVAVPPSTMRVSQPSLEIAEAIAAATGLQFVQDAVKKAKRTTQMKNITDYGQRSEILKDAFEVDVSTLKGRRVLLFDDLYQSGATLNSVATAIKQIGKAAFVYALVLTKTRG